MTSVISNFLCGHPLGAEPGAPSTCVRLTPPCGRHKWLHPWGASIKDVPYKKDIHPPHDFFRRLPPQKGHPIFLKKHLFNVIGLRIGLLIVGPYSPVNRTISLSIEGLLYKKWVLSERCYYSNTMCHC